MEYAAITGPGTAFLAGLVTSLHCAGMCGPLACAIMPAPNERVDASTVSTVYHLARLTGYGVLGALAGGVGRWPLTLLSDSTLRYLPWLFVLFFIAVALRFDQRLPNGINQSSGNLVARRTRGLTSIGENGRRGALCIAQEVCGRCRGRCNAACRWSMR